MKTISIGLLGNVFAIVVSVLSAFFAWQQTDIAREQTQLNRKSLVIEKKLQVCIDFLTTASEFEFRFENQITQIGIYSENKDPTKLPEGTVDTLLSAGYLSAVWDNITPELPKIAAQARLLLSTEIATKMGQYSKDANKARGEQFSRVWIRSNKKIMSWDAFTLLPAAEVDQLKMLKITASQIEALCGDLAERDAT